MQVAQLGPVKLNLDDLQDLQTLMATKTGEPVTVAVGKYDADQIEDLVNADDDDLASVVLSIPSKSFTVTLKKSDATVVCDSDEQQLLNLVEDVANFVNAKPMSRKIVYPALLMNIMFLQWAMLTFCTLVLMPQSDRVSGYWICGILTVFMLGYLCYLPRSWKNRGAVEVIPLNRHELRRRRLDSRSSAWSGVSGAIIGAVLGAGATIAAVYLNK
ncbi:hypothetical protein O3S69_04790 [Streptomyces rubrogriseus]|uniref:Uncharacterized protein n=1 Tax=Streptomyces rubrogriseus TaxID=194673 RepID=A0ABT4NW65_9ACTN|nr:hypothetical protein [Streptomyces anthocyanicus]MCZ4633369.1 hypothetical protein [Streptomyces rubrogriseus]